ncbi:hypothetical protein acsn021_29060 [Anaerocolumna cellulosilytica]|uniref:Uncharacterized protein n=1 Tax=Anaerocolumna cellulosilytica TaxID=433286 RepID=A0A6S6R5G2_9FIRM|nr:hypothetical protein [Anaerocolumna cellulosilytica]MBB5197124.1 hypothetical protein [Anaerocolumna cellulosilytica]BCJ95337.1 hypothetical protein acsn021_29060 [Anaerocolumna cellulosilytica]
MEVINSFSRNISEYSKNASYFNQRVKTEENAKLSVSKAADIESQNTDKNTANNNGISAHKKFLEDFISASHKAPYGELADNFGQINYNGVTFQCDFERNTISLGDMSDETKILTIPLSGGGRLKVNVNNIDDLAKTIDMFNANDRKRIMDALAVYAKLQSKKYEIEEEQNNLFQKLVEKNIK